MPTVMINGKKHTPGSNTLKKMKRKAAMEAANKKTEPKAKKVSKPKEEAPVPANRKKRPPKGLIKLMDPRTTPKGPKGRMGKSKAYTKGGNAGEKKSTVFGIGPKAKLTTDSTTMASYNYGKRVQGKK